MLLPLLTAGPAPAQQQFRAFWADVWGLGFKSTSDIDDMVARAVQGHYNVIVPEVLAYHDNSAAAHGAYWNSNIVPKAPDIIGGIDPLAYMCQQAHAQNIQVHVWLVPYRACDSEPWNPQGNNVLLNHSEYFTVPRANLDGGPVAFGDPAAFYLDPGSPDVQEYLLSIVRELVTNYPIDGIHFDYIRYVQQDAGYPARSWYTNSSLERFRRITGRTDTPPATGDSAWDNFRRRSITELVRRCRAEIPTLANPRQPVRLSAALITWGDAPPSFQGSNAWHLFQNWEEWQRLGFLDTAVPMTYYSESSYPTWYRDWVDKEMTWRYSRHMVVGPGIYLNTFSGSLAQMQYAQSHNADGLCTYCYRDTRSDSGSNWDWYPYIASNLFTGVVSPPAMPWRNPATATEGTIWGRVVTTAGSPVDDASVQVGSLSAVQTDGAGYYVVTMVPASSGGTNYTVSVTKSGLPGGSHPAAVVFAGDVVRYDFELGAAAPAIQLDTASFDRIVDYGQNAPDDTFTVRNNGDGFLNYTITDNASWLSAIPFQGTSSGETDTIAIRYATSSLNPGTHNATITVADAAATNTPQTISVTVHVINRVPGDFDGDGDVDQEDFGVFQKCLTGPNAGPPASGCSLADFDGDNDVDSADLGKFKNCMTGPEIQGNLACAG